MRAICVTLCFLFSFFNAMAQAPLSGMYKAKNGHVNISGNLDSVTISAQSDQLLIVLNCMDAEMTAKIDINTLSTGMDQYDTLLSASNEIAFFTGKMDEDIVNTQATLPLEFDIAGMLTLNSISKPMLIKASLQQIPDDENAGLLSGYLAISLDDFDLVRVMPNFSDLLLIHFTQVLLKRVCE